METERKLAEYLRMALWYWQVNTPLDQRGPTECDDMATTERVLHEAEARLKVALGQGSIRIEGDASASALGENSNGS